MSDSHIVLKSPDLSCETYLSTPQMVARTVTSQNNLKNTLHLTGSAKMKKVSKFPTCQSYPALLLPYQLQFIKVHNISNTCSCRMILIDWQLGSPNRIINAFKPLSTASNLFVNFVLTSLKFWYDCRWMVGHSDGGGGVGRCWRH